MRCQMPFKLTVEVFIILPETMTTDVCINFFIKFASHSAFLGGLKLPSRSCKTDARSLHPFWERGGGGGECFEKLFGHLTYDESELTCSSWRLTLFSHLSLIFGERPSLNFSRLLELQAPERDVIHAQAKN